MLRKFTRESAELMSRKGRVDFLHIAMSGGWLVNDMLSPLRHDTEFRGT